MKYSVVIPVKDEEGNIVPLIQEIEQTMEPLNEPWELICIDDGSTDTTGQILKSLLPTIPQMKIISFDSNYGQSSALDAGFKASKGDFVITLDGDGQNDPKDIPRLISNIQDFDLICGIRKKRKDTFSKRFISKIANYFRSRICDDGVQDSGCSLKIYRRNCLDKIKMYHGMHRFLPALFKIENFRIGQIDVNHRERLKGKSKYNLFNRSFNTIADLFAVYWMKKRQLKYKIAKIK